jgi:hypothetical protein
MMKNFMITLALCLCTATLFAQQNANVTAAKGAFNGRQITSYNYNNSGDDMHRKSAGELMDSIRNSPKWKKEIAGISAEFYNSAAWKKSKEDAARALPLWDTHSTTGNKAWQDAVGQSNAELESSEACKTYQAKIKDFNKRLEQETMRQLYKDDPRYKTAF